MSSQILWDRFKSFYLHDAQKGFAIDVSRMNFPDNYFLFMKDLMNVAFDSMQALEGGIVANADEQRMVGHYWLRKPILAPDEKIRGQIESTVQRIKEFTHSIHSGSIVSEKGEPFKHVLLVGIGGSALGPQFVSRALGSSRDVMDCYFFDNTDPDGMAKVIASIPSLERTLCVVISKSGGTKETRNGMIVAQNAWKCAGLKFASAAVAVTGEGSGLDKTAQKEGWLTRFPMWDWVGGRTSELSAVGILPAALQGFDIDNLLRGAREMDEWTRGRDIKKNPAALMASMWHFAGQGKGGREMVVLPYNDRLELFSRYLQQLVMESLGKEKDLDGRIVHQGLTVFGNKGSTDQHAYVQQLRDGLSNFFAVFIEVLKDKSTKTTAESLSGKLPAGFSAEAIEVEPGVYSGDYLSGFYQGTRKALYESGRQSITISVNEVTEYSVGGLIALFERAVGLYASLININAYHQPGVEAGKKAAQRVIDIQHRVVEVLVSAGEPLTVEQIAQAAGESESVETVFAVVRHLAANQRLNVFSSPSSIFEDRYSK